MNFFSRRNFFHGIRNFLIQLCGQWMRNYKIIIISHSSGHVVSACNITRESNNGPFKPIYSLHHSRSLQTVRQRKMTEEPAVVDWTQWQVSVCALIVVAPAAAGVAAILRSDPDPIRPSGLWKPCWKRVHPLWLLAYRFLVCVAMAYLLVEIVLLRGAMTFYFYTQ